MSRNARASATAVLVLLATGCSNAPEQGSAVRAPQVVKAGSLTVCTNLPYEPFEFEENGRTVGFDVDLATEVAERLELKPQFRNEDFDAIASGELLNKGTCDVAVAALTITGDRARVIDFSSPYFNAAQTMVVKGGAGLDSLDDLAGGRIAVQSGTTGELYLTDNAPSTAEIVTFDETSAMTGAVAAGEVLAAVYDNTVVGDAIAGNPDLEVAAEFDTGEQYGMAVKKNGSVDLLRTINDVLAELQHGDGYDRIFTKWFGAASA